MGWGKLSLGRVRLGQGKLICRHLHHDRFSAKNCNMSHRVAYTTCRISYIYCIRVNTRCHMSWVYCPIFGSWKVVYCRIYNFHNFEKNIFILFPRELVKALFLQSTPPHPFSPPHPTSLLTHKHYLNLKAYSGLPFSLS